MPTSHGQPITQAALDDLATQASSVLTPGGSYPSPPFAFSGFDADLPPPTNVTASLSYQTRDGDGYASGYDCDEVVVHLYSYRVSGGRKLYSTRYSIGSAKRTGSLPFWVTWSWTAAAGAAGYILDVRAAGKDGVGMNPYTGAWQDVTSPFVDKFVTFTITSTYTGTLVNPFTHTTLADYFSQRNPVDKASWDPTPAYGGTDWWAEGPWLRELNLIRNWILGAGALVPDATWRVSGPWCVSVGPVLRFFTDFSSAGATVYKGNWNANTNTTTGTPASLAGGAFNTVEVGGFFIVTVAGSTSLDGISSWAVGDFAVSNGPAAGWHKLEAATIESWKGYDNIAFWYAANDHGGDTIVHEVFEESLATPYDGATDSIGVDGSGFFAAHFTGGCEGLTFSAYGRLIWRFTGDVTGYAVYFTVASGSGTVDSTTPTVVGDMLILDYKVTLIGVTAFDVQVTPPGAVPLVWAYGDIKTTLDSHTLTPTTGVSALHPTSSVSKVSVADLVAPRANALAIDEDVDGVWSAMTFPVFAEHTMIQPDLSKYEWSYANYRDPLFPSAAKLMIEGTSNQGRLFLGKPTGYFSLSPAGFWNSFSSGPPLLAPRGNQTTEPIDPNATVIIPEIGAPSIPYGDPNPNSWTGHGDGSGGGGVDSDTFYAGTWNAATNLTAPLSGFGSAGPLVDGVGTAWWFYKVSVASGTAPDRPTIGGIRDWAVGEYVQFCASGWATLSTGEQYSVTNQWVKRLAADYALTADHHAGIVVKGVPLDALKSTDRLWITVGVQNTAYGGEGFSHHFPHDIIVVVRHTSASDPSDVRSCALMGRVVTAIPSVNVELTFGESRSLDGSFAAQSLPASGEPLGSALYIPGIVGTFPADAASVETDLAAFGIGTIDYNRSPHQLGVFQYQDPNGLWEIFVRDFVPLDAGSFNAWKITFAWGDGVAPAVPNRQALWPTLKDTDFWLATSAPAITGQFKVPYYNNDGNLIVSNVAFTNLANGTMTGAGDSPSPAGSTLVLQTTDPTMEIYWNTTGALIQPDGTGSDGHGTGRMVLSASGTGGYSFKAKNTSGSTIASGYLAVVLQLTGYTAGAPAAFFPSIPYPLGSGTGLPPGFEHYSFVPPGSNLGVSGNGYLQVPHNGQCITRLIVTRRPTGTGYMTIPGLPDGVNDGGWAADTNTPTLASGTGTAKHYRTVTVAGSTTLDGISSWSVGDVAYFTGTVWTKLTNPAALSVDVGIMRGAAFDTAGTFITFTTVTLPKGVGRVAVDVFWPVIGGCPLAYQAGEAVDIQAECNFQPLVCSTWWPPAPDTNWSSDFVCIAGSWSGPRRQLNGADSIDGPQHLTGAWTNVLPTQHFERVTLPVAPCLLDDMAAVLALL